MPSWSCRCLAEVSGVPVIKSPNLVEATQDTGAFVQFSGVLKRVACKLSKTCNDLRLLSSGPQAGFGDIKLPPRQAGSSIMPGKVNPVIPEVMNQVAFEVIGNDVTITMASEAGQLQLNAFEPIMGWSLFKSVPHLTQACKTLQVNCVDGIQANQSCSRKRVAECVTLVTALNPIIGYEKAALIAKTALADRRHDRRHRRSARHHVARRHAGAAGAGEADPADAALVPCRVDARPAAPALAPHANPCFQGFYAVAASACLPRISFSDFRLTFSKGDLMKKLMLVLAAALSRRCRACAGHAEEDQGQRQRSRWACASRPARCRTRSATASTSASTSRSARSVLADVQKQLGMAKLDIKYQPVTSQNRIPLVQNGTVDIECGSTTNNAARQKDVAFAPTTYVEEVRIAVKANSGINAIEQLNGKKVATTTGTTSVQHLRKHERGANVNFEEVFGKDHADSFLLLESGRADAFVMDGQILAGLISKSKNPADFKIVGEVLSVEPIAIMYRKDDAGVQEGGRRQHQGDDQERRARQDLRQVVRAADPAGQHEGRPAGVSDATKAAWANPNDKPMEEYAKK